MIKKSNESKYLCARRALDDTVAFSITELCHWSKLKPNYRDGKINQKYYDVLLLLSHYGYFVECPDFENYLHESTNSVKYQQVKLNIEKFDAPQINSGSSTLMNCNEFWISREN